MLDTGIARPPSPTYTAITPVTRAPEKARSAVKTDVPAAAAVGPSKDSHSANGTPRNGDGKSAELDAQKATLERRNIVDPESESIIFVARNTDTGEVVRQVPSESLRRLRAYAKAIEAQAAPAQPQTLQRQA